MKETELKKYLSKRNIHWRYGERPLRKRQIVRVWDMECSGILKKLAANMTPEGLYDEEQREDYVHKRAYWYGIIAMMYVGIVLACHGSGG